MSRKRSLSSHLSRKEPDESEFADAMAELIHSSDRVAAIMCSALVEHELISAISASLEDISNASALFHSGDASPFGTFKQRIVAGRALGIYNDAVTADLETIRDIRNQFAHALLKLDFENDHIARRCADLRHYLDWEEVEGRTVNACRLQFENVCLSISFGLLRKTARIYRTKAEQMEGLLALRQLRRSRDPIAALSESAHKDVVDEMLADKF